MIERLDQLEAAVDDLKATVARMENRIDRLEHDVPIRSEKEIGSSAGAPDLDLVSDIDDPLKTLMGTSTLVGRSLLVLAGAFLLRAMTENGTFAPAIGVAAGLVYAFVWIVASGVAASRASRASAGFYAACSAVIACPLLFEASTSFDVMSETASLVALAGITALGLFIATRWEFQSTAWVFSIGAVVTGGAIATVRPPGEAATVFLILLGLAIFWLAAVHDWSILKWVTTIAADLAVLRLTAIATATGARPDNFGPIHPPVVVFLQALLVVGYVGIVVVRAFRGRRPLTVFDFLQTFAVWIVGWGGALQLGRLHGWEMGPVSVLAVAACLAAYFGTFAVVDRRQGRNRAFYYTSSLALGLLLIGAPGVFGEATSAVWAIGAVVVAAIGSRWDRVTLRVHALLLIVAAWISSAFGARVVADFSGNGQAGWSGTIATAIVAIMTIGAAAAVLAGRKQEVSNPAERMPLTGLTALAACVISYAVASVLERLLPGTAALAAQTIALSVVTVLLALMASRWKISEAGWLVYPFLVVTGLRMIAVDFSAGQTVVLVIALAGYGAALIVSTRFLRTNRIEADAG